MKPQEILDELDRPKVTIWWQGLGRGPQPPVIRFDSRKMPPELAEQIRMNTAELHARLSQEHAAKAERLCEDPEPRARARDRKRYAAPLPYPAARGGGHRVQRMQQRAAWEQQRMLRREQEQRDEKRAQLEAHLSRRAQEWADTTGHAPGVAVLERWTADYLDTKELEREAEREARLAEAEAEHYTY